MGSNCSVCPQEEKYETWWEEMGYSANPQEWSEEERYEIAGEIFERFDKDNSGTVDPNELLFMMVEIDKYTHTFGPHRINVFAQIQMNEADVDRDGVLSRDEFLPFFVDNIITKGFDLMRDHDWDEDAYQRDEM